MYKNDHRLDIQPLEDMHTKIDLKSRKFLRICWRGFFAYVVVHCMAIPYLTFWAYSWDIMEPVTYMFNLWTLFLATWFYMNTNFEFSNEGISEAIRRTRREKLYVKYSFDIKLYKYLQERIADVEDDLLNPEWQMLKDVHPGLPDTVRNIHLHPKELFVQYGLSGDGGKDGSK